MRFEFLLSCYPDVAVRAGEFGEESLDVPATLTGRGNGRLLQRTSDDFGIRHTQLSRGPSNYHPVLSEDMRTDDGRILVFHIR